MEELKCHMCGHMTDFLCEDCDEPVCDECTVAYTPMNNCDGNQCQECYDKIQLSMGEELQFEQDIEALRDKKRKARNAKARDRYRMPDKVEKRRLKKEALRIERIRRKIESIKAIGNFMKGFNL